MCESGPRCFLISHFALSPLLIDLCSLSPLHRRPLNQEEEKEQRRGVGAETCDAAAPWGVTTDLSVDYTRDVDGCLHVSEVWGQRSRCTDGIRRKQQDESEKGPCLKRKDCFNSYTQIQLSVRPGERVIGIPAIEHGKDAAAGWEWKISAKYPGVITWAVAEGDTWISAIMLFIFC